MASPGSRGAHRTEIERAAAPASERRTAFARPGKDRLDHGDVALGRRQVVDPPAVELDVAAAGLLQALIVTQFVAFPAAIAFGRLGEWIDEVMEAYGDWYRGDEHVFPEGTGARARTNHYRLDCGSHCTVPRRSVYRKWCRLEPGKYGYDVKNLPMPPVGAWDWEALENHDLRGYGDHQEGLRLLVQEIPMAGEVGGGGHE